MDTQKLFDFMAAFLLLQPEGYTMEELQAMSPREFAAEFVNHDRNTLPHRIGAVWDAAEAASSLTVKATAQNAALDELAAQAQELNMGY